MSYATLEAQIKTLPEDCLEEVSRYIEFVLFKNEQKSMEEESDLSSFFGSVKSFPDGLSFQREARNEWD
jgi:hypothetical protein